jgi:tetratricopeptide (TPR) repeat protein
MANAALLNKNVSLAGHHMEKALELNPLNSETIANAAWNYGEMGDWERSKKLGLRAIEINPSHPRWYRGMLFGYYYQAGDYENALLHVLEYYQEDVLLSLVALAVSYAGLLRIDEANEVARQIERRFPKFVKNPDEELRAWGFEDKFIEKLVIGSRTAGVNFAQQR